MPADFATISRASRIGTPEESIVPKVRVNRATATFRTSGPNTGDFSTKACHISWPLPWRVASLNATKSTIGTATKMYQFARRPFERSTRNCVGPGSEPPMSLNIFSKVGTTKARRTATTPTATTSTIAG